MRKGASRRCWTQPRDRNTVPGPAAYNRLLGASVIRTRPLTLDAGVADYSLREGGRIAPALCRVGEPPAAARAFPVDPRASAANAVGCGGHDRLNASGAPVGRVPVRDSPPTSGRRISTTTPARCASPVRRARLRRSFSSRLVRTGPRVRPRLDPGQPAPLLEPGVAAPAAQEDGSSGRGVAGQDVRTWACTTRFIGRWNAFPVFTRGRTAHPHGECSLTSRSGDRASHGQRAPADGLVGGGRPPHGPGVHPVVEGTRQGGPQYRRRGAGRPPPAAAAIRWVASTGV